MHKTQYKTRNPQISANIPLLCWQDSLVPIAQETANTIALKNQCMPKCRMFSRNSWRKTKSAINQTNLQTSCFREVGRTPQISTEQERLQQRSQAVLPSTWFDGAGSKHNKFWQKAWPHFTTFGIIWWWAKTPLDRFSLEDSMPARKM